MVKWLFWWAQGQDEEPEAGAHDSSSEVSTVLRFRTKTVA